MADELVTLPRAGALVLLEGGQVLLGGPAVLDVNHMLQQVARLSRDRDGIGLSPRLRLLLATFAAAAQETRTAASGRPEVPQLPDRALSPMDPIDTKEAARMLGCGERNVRDLASRGVLPTSRHVGGRLQLDRIEVQAEADRRAQIDRHDDEEHDRAS